MIRPVRPESVGNDPLIDPKLRPPSGAGGFYCFPSLFQQEDEAFAEVGRFIKCHLLATSQPTTLRVMSL